MLVHCPLCGKSLGSVPDNKEDLQVENCKGCGKAIQFETVYTEWNQRFKLRVVTYLNDRAISAR
jgi:transcription elongation factor Elf1